MTTVLPSVLQENRLRRDFNNVAAGTAPQPMWLRVEAEIDQQLSDGRLEEALHRLLARHDALRSRFDLHADGPRCEVLEPAEVSIGLRHCAPEADSGSFDLAEAPLVRAYRSDTQPSIMTLQCDHRICDLMSLDILFDDLARLLQPDGGSGQPEPAPSYYEWAAAQRAALDGRAGELIEAFWRARLEPAGTFPPLALPAGDPSAPDAELRPAAVTAADSAALFAAGRRARLTPIMLVTYVLASAYCAITGTDRAVVHSPVANRPRSTPRGLVGWLAHSLPFPVRPADGPIGARAAMLAAIEHQAMPLPVITKRVSPLAGPRTSRPPRLFVTLVQQAVRRPAAHSAIRRLPFRDDLSGPAEPGVSLYVTDDGQRQTWCLNSSPREVDRAFIDELGAAIGHEVRALHELAQPELR